MRMKTMNNKMMMKARMKIIKNQNKCWNTMMIMKNLKNIKFYKNQSIMQLKGIKKSKILLDFVKEDIFLRITIYMNHDFYKKKN